MYDLHRVETQEPSGWATTLKNYDIIVLMKGIKGLIFKHADADYLYTRMRSALRAFLNLQQGGIFVADYPEQWTTRKYITDEFGYKVVGSKPATKRECKVGGIDIPCMKGKSF